MGNYSYTDKSGAIRWGNTPSFKALESAFTGKGRELYSILTDPRGGKLARCSEVLEYYGVEYIPAGTGSNAPSIHYVNSGDTYDTTILKIRGNYKVGNWGDIVERGNYE